jgi:hypothetical protein
MKVASSAGRVDPRSTDVLLGRGNGVSIWKGNVNFRHIVWEYRDAYRQAVRYEKGKIAQKVFQHISTLSPPGRFLEMIEDDHFYIVDRERAIEKVCQALREKKSRLVPNGTVDSAPLNSCITKMRRYPKQLVAIAPAPMASDSRCVLPSSTEIVQTCVLDAMASPSTASSSTRKNVVTPDNVNSPGFTITETGKQSIKRLLFPCVPLTDNPNCTTPIPPKKAKLANNDDPYSRNTCTETDTGSQGIHNANPFPVQQIFDDRTPHLVSFSPNENTYELSDNRRTAMYHGDYAIVSTGSSWSHQQSNQPRHSQTVDSSADRPYKKHQPNAIDALLDYEDSIDMHLERISVLSVADIEHGARYIKSSIEILDEAFALIRNVTGEPPIHVPTEATSEEVGPVGIPATALETYENSAWWSSTSSLGDCTDSVFSNEHCMTDFTSFNYDMNSNCPNKQEFDLSVDNFAAL